MLRKALEEGMLPREVQSEGFIDDLVVSGHIWCIHPRRTFIVMEG
jgi:hypothetical protein